LVVEDMSIVGVVVGTVAGEGVVVVVARQRSQKFEMVKFEAGPQRKRG